MNIPNIITSLRIVIIPVFIAAFYLPFDFRYPLSACLFTLAAASDWLDGYLARRLKQNSPLGAFLDPVADKLLVATALVLLVQTHSEPALAIAAVVIISREIIISALREWMAELGQRAHISVSYLGKCKTAAQMIALIVLLSQPPDWTRPLLQIGYVLLYLAVILTLWSMILYCRAAWLALRPSASENLTLF